MDKAVGTWTLEQLCRFVQCSDLSTFRTRFRVVSAFLASVFRETRRIRDSDRLEASHFFSDLTEEVLEPWDDARLRSPVQTARSFLQEWIAQTSHVESEVATEHIDLFSTLRGSDAPEPEEFVLNKDFAHAVVRDIELSNATLNKVLVDPGESDDVESVPGSESSTDSDAPPEVSSSRVPVRQRRAFPIALSDGVDFASHFVRPVGTAHSDVAAAVVDVLGRKDSQQFSTMVLLSSSRTGKTKVPYSIAQSPKEGLVPVILRVASASRLTPPWEALREKLRDLSRCAPVDPDGFLRSSVGQTLHVLLFSVHIEWVVIMWSKALEGITEEQRSPRFFLEFVARVLWNGTSDEAIARRFKSICPTMETFTTVSSEVVDEFITLCKKRMGAFLTRLVGQATDVGVKRAVGGRRDPAVVLFVDEASEWKMRTCFLSASAGSAVPNLYGLVGAAEILKDSSTAVVLMGTTWTFTRELMISSSPIRTPPRVWSKFPMLEPSQMCDLLDYYFDFGVGGVRKRFPGLAEAVFQLRGRPSFFVDKFLGTLSRTPEKAASERELIQLVEAIVKEESTTFQAMFEADFEERGDGAVAEKRNRSVFVEAMVLAMATHSGVVDRSRFVELFAHREAEVPSVAGSRKQATQFSKLVFHPGYVFGSTDSSLSVHNEPIVGRALRQFIAREMESAEQDSYFAFFARSLTDESFSGSKGPLFERALAWLVAKPRSEPPTMDSLFTIPERLWSANMSVDAREVVFFRQAKSDWEDERLGPRLRASRPHWTGAMFRSELHALFNWEDPERPIPALDRVVASTVDGASGPDLLFFASRPLERRSALRDGETAVGARAVRLVAVQCKSGVTTFVNAMKSLDVQTMNAEGGLKHRRAVLRLLNRRELQPFFRGYVRLVVSVCSISPKLCSFIDDWNEKGTTSPVEAANCCFGPSLSKALRLESPQQTLDRPSERTSMEDLVKPFDSEAVSRALDRVVRAIQAAEEEKRLKAAARKKEEKKTKGE